jgi:hypothetical protein
MNARDAIQAALTSTRDLFGWYLGDLSDADLLVRPVPGANHIAWQVGHVIASEQRLAAQVPGAAYPELPADFADQHGPKTANVDPPTGFATKNEYIDLFNRTRAATLAIVAKMNDADLDKPYDGPVAKFAPTLGALMLLMANHTMMHAGQFTVVRRKLGKPVLF